ncbi:MAG TPA: type II toxin-antitoxin system VapC family toxin [Terriglobales bacterium]|jgi:tRNA(fMet)-specific endonuclease VapC|nr:type II toxin-antitoxin system VapC family toxin [Terriglobales bacterium]
MSVRYLLDTNTASYAIKGNYPRVRARLARLAISDVGISTVTEAELRFGAERLLSAARMRVAIAEFLEPIRVLAWDSPAAEQYAYLRTALERSGTPVGNMDLMIAAHALAIKAVLVTHDRVFRHVKSLRIEDWT